MHFGEVKEFLPSINSIYLVVANRVSNNAMHINTNRCTYQCQATWLPLGSTGLPLIREAPAALEHEYPSFACLYLL
jgi:hypothetical protein